ncbi:uncharacterized protein LOC115441738 isoform X1 [Manduca sexta]|uniref:uncharacterized protein LOC115441738 isoform X1 n=1 Tax=Manduca sexta TaxID=7130 RepID=UPI0018901A91|nr:uncharacterized protein LOC115441738 isoform X1 [Manduca sexta]
MGDIIEFVTSPSLGHRCFKIQSSGINFDIKSFYYAAIVLSKKGENMDHIWIIIRNGVSWVQRMGHNRVLAKTPGILSGNFYSRFWLTWSGDIITFGKNGHVEPILKFPNKSPKSMYVRFITHTDEHAVHWRVELPPLLKQPSINHIVKGKLRWVPAYTQLPDDALIGGFEKEKLYIMRANHRGSLTPGKLVPSEGVGYIAWGYEAHEKTEFEVLCGYNCKWVPSKKDRIPAGAVKGGYSEVQREMLYIGRALHRGYLIPGKVQPSHRVSYIPYNGKTVAMENYEILTVPSERRCINKYILPNKTSCTEFRIQDYYSDSDHYADDDSYEFMIDFFNPFLDMD